MLVQKFSDNINAKVRGKTRAEDLQHGRQKRKYFRQPKIYQNSYIEKLRDHGQIIEIYEEQHDEHALLFLFVREKDLTTLLLGREERHPTKGSKASNDSYTGKSSVSEISKTSSQLMNA